MDLSTSSPPTRHRGLALLLALFYGILTGATLSPLPAEAQPQAASAFAKRLVLAPAVNDGRAAVKNQRFEPNPVILPPLAGEVRTLVLHPAGERATTSRHLAAARGGSPYRARAPPAD